MMIAGVVLPVAIYIRSIKSHTNQPKLSHLAMVAVTTWIIGAIFTAGAFGYWNSLFNHPDLGLAILWTGGMGISFLVAIPLSITELKRLKKKRETETATENGKNLDYSIIKRQSAGFIILIIFIVIAHTIIDQIHFGAMININSTEFIELNTKVKKLQNRELINIDRELGLPVVTTSTSDNCYAPELDAGSDYVTACAYKTTRFYAFDDFSSLVPNFDNKIRKLGWKGEYLKNDVEQHNHNRQLYPTYDTSLFPTTIDSLRKQNAMYANLDDILEIDFDERSGGNGKGVQSNYMIGGVGSPKSLIYYDDHEADVKEAFAKPEFQNYSSIMSLSITTIYINKTDKYDNIKSEYGHNIF
jgi:hypothetical protein